MKDVKKIDAGGLGGWGGNWCEGGWVYDSKDKLTAIYCPASFFFPQNSTASSRLKFPLSIATSTKALSTPSPIPFELPHTNTLPSNALITNQTKSA